MKGTPKQLQNDVLKYYDLGYNVTLNTVMTIKKNGHIGPKILARINKTKHWEPNSRGQFVFTKILALKLSLTQLAKYFNVSRQTLARYIRGEGNREVYKVSQHEINDFIDHIEGMTMRYNIKPSIILEKAIIGKNL